MEDPSIGPKLHHTSKFMIMEPWRHPSSSREQSVPLSDMEPGTESEGPRSSSGLETLKYQGYYELFSKERPGRPQLGWVLDRGRWNSQTNEFAHNGTIDLMLAPFGGPSST